MKKQTREKIRKLIQEADPEWARERRIEYLKSVMAETVIEAWSWIAKYDRLEAVNCVEMMVYVGEVIFLFEYNMRMVCI
jgi:hypothetical protein